MGIPKAFFDDDMKRVFAFILAFCLLFLCSCTNAGKEPSKKEYFAITQIDKCVVEPDEKAVMTKDDEKFYRKLMDAVITRKDSVTLSDDETKNKFYIDLLMQSPYYFFLSACELNGSNAKLTFAYEKDEQDEMCEFLDSEFLKIANYNAAETDNELDTVLKIYYYISKGYNYDYDRTDNKNLDSPLFTYPDKEVYNFLKDKKGLCYGFAYTMRFVLLQRGIDCFCVYGDCIYNDDSHMWNIFKYDGEFFICDSAWDRANDTYARLYNFGKTDEERISDALDVVDFSTYHFEEYGKVECTDKRFLIFRTVMRFSYVEDHKFFMEEFGGEHKMFDTEKFEFI